jgi:asparagine synthase (glutamine-hydrolysing)
MCGITAALCFKPLAIKHLVAMNNQIIHRGPDDGGFVFFTDNVIEQFGVDETNYGGKTIFTPKQNISQANSEKTFKLALGHRRLSIVDLSPFGHQPMLKNDYWITYNGEIYNYIEIRNELMKFGYTFISESDTEVILAAYQRWGKECLQKFNGMFAFVIYDTIKHEIFAARDRFGVKPLYYYQNASGIFFASEIKQFTVLPDWSAKLNHQRAYDFLVHSLSDHTAETMFRGVNQLRGGEYLIIELDKLIHYEKNGVASKRWYKLVANHNSKNYESASNEFENLFRKSIQLRLRSDVEIGSCLSGGLDSSAIVCTMAQELYRQDKTDLLKTFSACSHHKEFDESEYIDIVNQATSAESFRCYPELTDLFQSLDAITWHQDEPFGSTSIYAQWSVFELAKHNNLKVMLDGQGADEQLAGYQGLYFQILLNQLLSKGNLVQYCKELYYLHKYHKFNIRNGMLKSLLSLMPVSCKHIIGKVLGKNRYKTDWVNTQVLKITLTDPMIQTGLDNKSVQNTLYGQIVNNNLPMLLHWEDRDSMAHSIESRVPFLDYQLVELLIALPYDYKIKNGVTKKVMRDGLMNILPRSISGRMSKLGFVTPEEVWVKNNPELFKAKLVEAINLSAGILDREIVLSMFNEIVTGKRAFDFWLWRLISFGTWMKLFKVNI